MCLPLCSVCGRAIKVGDRAAKIQKGEIDLTFEFQADEEELVHEECLASAIV